MRDFIVGVRAIKLILFVESQLYSKAIFNIENFIIGMNIKKLILRFGQNEEKMIVSALLNGNNC